jgi:hypothetical protein
MRGKTSQAIPADLARAAGRFAEWRRRREFGARIPESLWRSALALSARHGLNRTAKVLRLDYYSLKQRIKTRASVPMSRPTFVELAAWPLTTTSGCLVELTNAAGATLRIHLPGTAIPDLVALSRSVWNTE